MFGKNGRIHYPANGTRNEVARQESEKTLAAHVGTVVEVHYSPPDACTGATWTSARVVRVISASSG
ncbi:hypothetical protein ABZ816_00490 [Actinosynnema sp. NPDC047251]|uniref:hypothetical protein n=1 Tax=Saccharothrix espanaensis TaxID=103731 RepID=UPI0002E92426|nr:hypothetical protein [Saccharothrix espanaensis]